VLNDIAGNLSHVIPKGFLSEKKVDVWKAFKG
jgi:hypothetical protein